MHNIGDFSESFDYNMDDEARVCFKAYLYVRIPL